MAVGIVQNFLKVTHAELFEIQKLWHLKNEPQFFRHVANEIYFAKTKNDEVVVRITDKSTRSFKEIQAELDWMEHLRRDGLRVCEVVLSEKGHRVEEINEKLVVVFKRFPGQRLEESQLTEEHMNLWAKTLAKMHNSTEKYQPARAGRNIWFDDSLYLKAVSALDSADEEVQKKFKEMDHKLRKWPRTSKSFGLIHADLHTGNFFFQGDDLLIFDFDDCCYHFFNIDVAIPVRILCREFYDSLQMQKRDRLIQVFFKSYFSVRPPLPHWKIEFELCYRYFSLITHLWLLAILNEREMPVEQRQSFQEAIDMCRQQGLSEEISDVLKDQPFS